MRRVLVERVDALAVRERGYLRARVGLVLCQLGVAVPALVLLWEEVSR